MHRRKPHQPKPAVTRKGLTAFYRGRHRVSWYYIGLAWIINLFYVKGFELAPVSPVAVKHYYQKQGIGDWMTVAVLFSLLLAVMTMYMNYLGSL